MVLFFIADLAFSVAFKVSAWCLGKTCDGIAYLVSRRNKPKDGIHAGDNDNDNANHNDIDCEFIVISRDDYRALRSRQKRLSTPALASHEPASHEPASHEPASHEPASHEPASHEPESSVPSELASSK